MTSSVFHHLSQQMFTIGCGQSLAKRWSAVVGKPMKDDIGDITWLRELENISVGHGVSLLCWRSGGLEHPHDTPPYPFTPSPTFVHSSALRDIRPIAVNVSAEQILLREDRAVSVGLIVNELVTNAFNMLFLTTVAGRVGATRKEPAALQDLNGNHVR
jgi:hypothetical protein